MALDIPALCKEINTSNWMGVLSITGGGAGAVNEITKRGGASNMLLDTHTPWANSAFNRLVKGTPDKYVSEHAARQLAMAAYLEAVELEGKGNKPVFGLGSSCALAKNGPERREREHKVCIAYQTFNKTCIITFNLPHLGREHEELFVSDLIIRMLGDCVQKTEGNWVKELGYTEDLLVNRDEYVAPLGMIDVVHGKSKFWCPETTKVVSNYMFPGSFNPLHDGHREMVQIAEEEGSKELTGKRVLYEISATNADKPPLDYIEIRNRVGQFKDNVILMNAPLVIEKARTFPKTTFLCGYDSWVRIIDPKYYHNDTAERDRIMAEFKHLDCKFMVFARQTDGVVRELSPGIPDFGIAFPAPKVPQNMGCSSTAIRKAALSGK